MIAGEYLLQEVRDSLRTNLEYVVGSNNISTSAHNKSIQIMPDEKVPPSAGEEFISLYGSKFVNSHPAQTMSAIESYSLSVGITRRIQAQPVDRLGDTIYTEDTEVIDRIRPSMLLRAREIIDLIDGIFTIIQTVNVRLEDDNECILLTPLGLVSGDAQPKYVDEDHFFTNPDSSTFHKGLFMELTFGGAELLRPK